MDGEDVVVVVVESEHVKETVLLVFVIRACRDLSASNL